MPPLVLMKGIGSARSSPHSRWRRCIFVSASRQSDRSFIGAFFLITKSSATCLVRPSLRLSCETSRRELSGTTWLMWTRRRGGDTRRSRVLRTEPRRRLQKESVGRGRSISPGGRQAAEQAVHRTTRRSCGRSGSVEPWAFCGRQVSLPSLELWVRKIQSKHCRR